MHDVTGPVKLTIFIKESVEKNKSISSKHGGFRIVFKLVRKRLFERNYIFLYFFLIIVSFFSFS